MSSIQRNNVEITRRMLSIAKLYFAPYFAGSTSFDPMKPALLVGNHTLYGLLDVPFLLDHLYGQHAIVVRSLGDRLHFSVPMWREFLAANGTVLGTPENCDRLMESGQYVLVFPGGGREVMRRKGEQYKLIWKNRLGFVRMAIKHGYDILPFGSLGADECFTILADADDYRRVPVFRKLLNLSPLQAISRGGDELPPLVRGLGVSLVPRPQRFYFGFGERIPTGPFQGRENDECVLRALRDEVAASIRGQLAQLESIRREDRDERWSWLRRRLTNTQSVSDTKPFAIRGVEHA